MSARSATRPSLRPARRAVSVVCSAQKPELGTAVAAAALATVVGFSNVQPAAADVAGLTPCSESKAFAKLEKKELKNLNKRLKNVRKRRWRYDWRIWFLAPSRDRSEWGLEVLVRGRAGGCLNS